MDAQSRKPAGISLHAHSRSNRSAQSKIRLAVLQTGAQRSIHKERFVSIARGAGGEVRWRSGCKLIDFVFRSGAEAALLSALPALWPARTLGILSRPWLQIQAPFKGCRCWTDLRFLVSRLKPEHLDFESVGSRREIGQFIVAGFIRGGHRAMTAFGRDHCRARHRLPAEFDRSRGCDAGLRA